ncbi:facilitated trehalose transporter Tret1-like isoform X2 [Homarus americanus]|uniref:facilitated trehalose transporter Tret1-like isoform X2 n=1 Tax=Homarus americanus TaxID=6706 RepID=UPI001C440CDE|nr:facilitated trehalose transporter Tret1-like isoform X2 [Homarus americanus]
MADNESEGEWSPWGGEEEEELVQPLISTVDHHPSSIMAENMDDTKSTTSLVGGHSGSRTAQYFTAFAATMGALAMGTVLGYSSPAGVKLMSNSTTGSLHLTKEQNMWFSSSMNLGALVGGPVGGVCLNTLGRRGTIMALVAPFSLGWLLIALARNFAMLISGRIVTGLCAGMTSLVVPTYIGEYASADVRGTLGKDCNIQTELDMMRQSMEEAKHNKTSLKDFMKPYILKPLMISLTLMFFQQFSGVNPVLFNLTTIFSDAGSKFSDNVSSIIIGVVQVAATFLATVLMDKAGRKLLLIVSSSLMALSIVALGEFFYEKMEDESWAIKKLSWLPLVSLIIFISAFSIGYGPIPWLMIGELFPSNVKEAAGSFSTMVNWSLSFVVTLSFVPLQSVLGVHGVYWLYGSICVVNLLFCVTLVPETKGKTLDEITAYFGGPFSSGGSQRAGTNEFQVVL